MFLGAHVMPSIMIMVTIVVVVVVVVVGMMVMMMPWMVMVLPFGNFLGGHFCQAAGHAKAVFWHVRLVEDFLSLETNMMRNIVGFLGFLAFDDIVAVLHQLGNHGIQHKGMVSRFDINSHKKGRFGHHILQAQRSVHHMIQEGSQVNGVKGGQGLGMDHGRRHHSFGGCHQPLHDWAFRFCAGFAVSFQITLAGAFNFHESFILQG